MTSRTNASSTARPHASSASSVRRNLFHHHLSRRPTASSTNTSVSTVQVSPEDHSADIVIRDRNGEYQVELPMMPEEKMEEVVDKEKEEARLTDAVKHHCRDRNRTPSEPAELLAAVQASLRNKVEGLQEDYWMYEREEEEEGGS